MRITLLSIFLAGCGPSILPPPPPEPSVDERREVALTWLRTVLDTAATRDRTLPRYLAATGPSAEDGYRRPIWHDSAWLARHSGDFTGICALHQRCIRSAPSVVFTVGMPTPPAGDTSYIHVDYGIWAPQDPCPSATHRPSPPATIESGMWVSQFWVLRLRRVADHWTIDDPGFRGIGGRLDLPCTVAG